MDGAIPPTAKACGFPCASFYESFIWSDTPQGHGFWSYINCFYLDWSYEILESKTHKYLNNFNRGHLLKQLK